MERSVWHMMTLSRRCQGPLIPLRKIPLQIFRPLQWRLQMASRPIIRWWTVIRAKLVCRRRINHRRRIWNHPRSLRLPSILLIKPQRSSSKLLMSHHSWVLEEIHQVMANRNPLSSTNTDRVPCIRLKISAKLTLPEGFLLLIIETKMLKSGSKRLPSIPILSMDSLLWRE